MRRVIIILILLCSLNADASRRFLTASAQYINLNTTVGNWERTQPWSVSVWVNVITNISGCIIGKQNSSGVGWEVNVNQLAGNPGFNIAIASASNLILVRTASTFPTNTWYNMLFTYDGSSTAAGCNIWLNGTNQSLNVAFNNLAATILNSQATQIGSDRGSGTDGLDGYERRLLLYNRVISGADFTNVVNGTSVPTNGLQVWQEFGPFNDGATYVADWSGNANVGFTVAGPVFSAVDPVITSLLPPLPGTGPLSLAGPLTKSTPQPMAANLGYLGSGNPYADQIGPSSMIKRGVHQYVGWWENYVGYKSIDTANEPGAFDKDSVTIYCTSPDGYNWTFVNEGFSTNISVPINCTNVGGGAVGGSFRTQVKGETSCPTVQWDPDDFVWKGWFHGGNNTGPRMIWYVKSSTDPSTNSWTVQNSGNAVLTNGASGFDASGIADVTVIRQNPSFMQMFYKGRASNNQMQDGLAFSIDRGLTWQKYTNNPVFGVGAAGAWDSGEVHSGHPIWDQQVRAYALWYMGTTNIGDTHCAIGFAYSYDLTNWTKSPYNPVMSSATETSSLGAFEYYIGVTTFDYLDDEKYRLGMYAADGTSGNNQFGGQIEATLVRTVKTPYRFFQ